MNSSIATFVENSWKTEVATKPSLKYVNSESLKVGQSHPIWSTVRLNTLDNKRAQLKCKILTGTYILQGNRAVFNQYAVDPTCKLCLKSPETRQHFIAECPVFEYERQEFLGKVKTNTDLLNSKNALDGNLPGLFFGLFYSRYWVIFPMPKSIFFSQFSVENSQFQIRKKIEKKSLFLSW